MFIVGLYVGFLGRSIYELLMVGVYVEVFMVGLSVGCFGRSMCFYM